MKCLYCGGPLTLALLKKITGAGEFCSDECRRGYQSEFNRLAVGRLQQARANRRVIPTSAGPVLPAAAASPAHFGEMKPISEAPPAPLWTQSPLPPPAAKPMSGLVMVCEEVVPVPSVLPDPQVPAAPELTSLFEAVRAERAVEIVEPECAAGSSKLALSDAKSDCEEEVWMAPRGLFPLSVRAQAIAADLKIPVLSPAPIFVYLQLPESLVSTSIGRPRLFAAGTAEMKLGKQSGEHPLRVGVLEPMSQGLRNALQAGSRVAERVFTSPAGFSSDQCYGLSFSWPAAAEPVAFSNLQFRPPAPSVGRALVAELPCQDPRFDVYLQSDGRMELRQRLRELSERRAAQRAQGDAGPTVTLPLKTVEPALNLLAAFGTAMLERQSRLGDSPPAMSFPEPAMSLSAEELLPKLVAGLTAMPLAEPRSAYPAPSAPVPGGPATGGDGFPALPQAPGASTSHQPSPHQGAPYQGAPHQSTPHQTALHPGPAGPSGAGEAGYTTTPHTPAAPYPPPPAPIADGRPAGWPADVPYPPEGALALPPAAAPLAQQPAPMAQAPVAPPLPGMPAISGNVYMFGTEINSGGEQ